jgi:hypothetical protein
VGCGTWEVMDIGRGVLPVLQCHQRTEMGLGVVSHQGSCTCQVVIVLVYIVQR